MPRNDVTAFFYTPVDDCLVEQFFKLHNIEFIFHSGQKQVRSCVQFATHIPPLLRSLFHLSFIYWHFKICFHVRPCSQILKSSHVLSNSLSLTIENFSIIKKRQKKAPLKNDTCNFFLVKKILRFYYSQEVWRWWITF